MITSWKLIGDQIQAKLDTFVGVGQPLIAALDAHDTKFEGYPVATWEWEEGENEILTTAENKRTYIATIYVHHEFQQATRSTANRIIAEILSDLQDAFDGDQTMSGTCDYTLPGPARWGVYQESAGMVRWGSIKIYFVASTIVA